MALGRVVNPLARPIDGKKKLSTETYTFNQINGTWLFLDRSVHEPLQTGLLAIGAMIPIGVVNLAFKFNLITFLTQETICLET
jgi:F0F1-type ATP synthase alpha subunit